MNRYGANPTLFVHVIVSLLSEENIPYTIDGWFRVGKDGGLEWDRARSFVYDRGDVEEDDDPDDSGDWTSRDIGRLPHLRLLPIGKADKERFSDKYVRRLLDPDISAHSENQGIFNEALQAACAAYEADRAERVRILRERQGR